VAKVAFIFFKIFFYLLPLTKNLFKGGISGQIDKTKVIKGTKSGNQKNNQPNQSVHAHARAQKRASTACFSILGKVIKTKNDQGTIVCIQIGSSKLKRTIPNHKQN
jgi:hypothetical protein